MWEVVSGERVFSSYKPPQISRKIWEAGDRPDLDDFRFPNLAPIISTCWSKSAGARPSVDRIILAGKELAGSSANAKHHEVSAKKKTAKKSKK